MAKKRIIVYIWISCLVIAAIGFVLITWFHPQGILNKYWVVLPSLFTVSVFCEYIDSSLGMGYGTTLTPTLLILGVVRQEIVPVILLSEFLTGIFSAIAHTKEGNVIFKNNSNIKKSLLLLVIPSFIGAIVSTFLGSRLKSLGQHNLNIYIGFMILVIGIYLVYKNYFNKKKGDSISVPRLMTLGLIASFNKGLSGGGYGPLLTGGQLAAGVREKEAIVITSICESFTCFIGLTVFFILGGKLNLYYTIPICMGALISVIPAVKTVKILPQGMLSKTIGWATIFLGLITLWKFLS
ncbi:MAG: sulfite exporter TauE/SafE family protein [Bacteroidales bacterium]|nr:sulfite exporter TauE/SafE family protein [Bacteroidales bacterium]